MAIFNSYVSLPEGTTTFPIHMAIFMAHFYWEPITLRPWQAHMVPKSYLKLRRKTRPRSLRCLKARWQVGFCGHGLLKLVDFQCHSWLQVPRFLGIDM